MGFLKERTWARGVALQALYEKDLSTHPDRIILEERFKSVDLDEEQKQFAEEIYFGVVPHEIQIDQFIEKYAPEWPIDQVAVIDRNIIRISVWEFAIRECTPVSVAINEAVELAKTFGSDSAPRFVNGVLGSIAAHKNDIKVFLTNKNVGKAD